MRKNRQKSILIIAGDLNIGGAERHIVQVLPLLNKKKYSVVIYTLTHKGVLASRLEQVQIDVISPFNDEQFYKLNKFRKALRLVYSSWILFGYLRKNKPNIVHFFLPMPYIIGFICAKIARSPKMVMSRRSLNYYQKKYPFISKIEPILHQSMQRIMGNSKAVIRQLRDEENVPLEKLKLIYNGIDVSLYDKPEAVCLAKRLRLDSVSLILIMVANLLPYKGHEDLLYALHGIRENLPDDWVLLCVGDDRGIQKKLEEISVRLGIRKNIWFIGSRQDIPELLSIAQIGLLCSHEEGFSNSILEGMASKLPMIVTDVGGNSEAVVNNETGFVVSPKSPNEIGEKIKLLATNPKLREQMGMAGRQRVEELFSLSKCISEYEKLYGELTEEMPL